MKVKVAEYHPDLTKKYKFYMVPSRWVHELYPVDEIFQRDLGLPKEAFSVELVDDAKETYSLEATDAAGQVVYRTSFSPKTVEREYLEKFPGWSRVDRHDRVVVGLSRWNDRRRSAHRNRSRTLLGSLSVGVLPRIYDNVMKVTDNRPLPDKQPFHRDLDIEVWMSEPDFRIGIDEELVSSLEALHEDLYFVTLDFFDALGRTTTRRGSRRRARSFRSSIPIAPGKPGEVSAYAGNASTRPSSRSSTRRRASIGRRGSRAT